MKKIINVGNKQLECACNALTPFIYTEVFGKDFLKVVVSFRTYAGKDTNSFTEDEMSDITIKTRAFSEMLFVMNKQHQIGNADDLMKLTKTDYYNWLADFEQGDFGVEVMSDVLSLWQGQTKTNVESKNV